MGVHVGATADKEGQENSNRARRARKLERTRSDRVVAGFPFHS
jgi:hypothetical protein